MNIQIEKTSDHTLIAKLDESVQTLHHQLYPEKFKEYEFASISRAFECDSGKLSVFGQITTSDFCINTA